MRVSGLKFTEQQVIDSATTFLFVALAVLVPGYIQLHTGISAIKLSFSITLLYLAVHIALEHKSEFH